MKNEKKQATNLEMTKAIHITKESFPEHVKNAYKSIRKKKITPKKTDGGQKPELYRKDKCLINMRTCSM